MTLLATGSADFIGSNFVPQCLPEKSDLVSRLHAVIYANDTENALGQRLSELLESEMRKAFIRNPDHQYGIKYGINNVEIRTYKQWVGCNEKAQA